MLKYDFLALLPGSSVPFSFHTLVKFLLYLGFALFVLFLFYSPSFLAPRHLPESTPSLERPI